MSDLAGSVLGRANALTFQTNATAMRGWKPHTEEASQSAIQGTAEQALQAFTLMKVIGRDIWIGIWAFIFALIATTRWEVVETEARPEPRRDLVALPEIRRRLSDRLRLGDLDRRRLQLRRI